MIVKTSRRWIPERHGQTLMRLHAEGKRDSEIATLTGFSVHTVRSNRKGLGLASNYDGAPAMKKLAIEKPINTKPAKEPGWDFSRDNLALPPDI